MRSVRLFPFPFFSSLLRTNILHSVRAMHQYRLPSVPFTTGQPSSSGYPPRPTNDSKSMMTLESAAEEPLIQSQLDDEDVVFDADEESQTEARGKGKGKARETAGELIPYAHRDIKPGYVCLLSASWDRG